MESIQVKILTLSKLWTGDHNQNGDQVIVTGLIGSFRWWMEALVRGMGGFACDPTGPESCSFNMENFKRVLKPSSEDAQINLLNKAIKAGLNNVCPICRIFGCSGYQGSIQFTLSKKNQRKVRSNSLTGVEAGNIIELELIPLRTLAEEEKWLLKKTFELISLNGSIGGRNVYKPESNKGEDYGIVQIDSSKLINSSSYNDVEKWLGSFSLKKNNEKLPNLEYFWFINGNYLKTVEINQIFKLTDDPYLEIVNGQEREFLEFLRGIRYSENKNKPQTSENKYSRKLFSKKIFSFKGSISDINGTEVQSHTQEPYTRVWGYVRNDRELKWICDEICKVNDSYLIKNGQKLLNEWRIEE